MKYILPIIVSILLLSCGGSGSETSNNTNNSNPFSKLNGAWESDDPNIPIVFEFSFSDDGKYSQTMGKESFEGTWAAEGSDRIRINNDFTENGKVWIFPELNSDNLIFYEEGKEDRKIKMKRK